jgi:hypothetical protein
LSPDYPCKIWLDPQICEKHEKQKAIHDVLVCAKGILENFGYIYIQESIHLLVRAKGILENFGYIYIQESIHLDGCQSLGKPVQSCKLSH